MGTLGDSTKVIFKPSPCSAAMTAAVNQPAEPPPRIIIFFTALLIKDNLEVNANDKTISYNLATTALSN